MRSAETDAIADGSPTDPAVALRMVRALENVRRVDPVGYAMLIDFLHDRFDASAWSGALGSGAASVTDRKFLAIYRYAVYFHDVLELVDPHPGAVALAARRFTPGDPDEQAALAATRAALGGPELTLAEWRQVYREAGARSLALLASPEALGSDAMADLERPFRRVLRLDVKSPRS
jgi:hypothetical protein